MATCVAKSHPTWVRGLKLYEWRNHRAYRQSHPTWVRGLKQDKYIIESMGSNVAPHVGCVD